MIDWKKTESLNDMTVNELKVYFNKRPGSHKLIIRICDKCDEEKIMTYKEYRPLCKNCKMKSPETRKKMSDNHANVSGSKNPNFGKTGELSLIFGNKNMMFGKHHSEEIKYKCGNGSRNRIQTEEEKEKRRISNTIACTLEVRQKISDSISGKNHYNWKGGISNDPYPMEFNESLKTKIRSKYNSGDYISGLHKNICNGGKTLAVHHIDYDKQNCNKNNLIPLSYIHHAKTNLNRSFWNRLFKYSLEIDKWYYNTDSINIWR